MTDLAVIDLDNPGPPDTGRVVAVLGDFGRGDAGSEASLASLMGGLGGVRSLIPSATPEETAEQYGAISAHSEDRRAVARLIGQADGVVLVNPELTTNAKALRRMAFLVARARMSGKPVALVNLSVMTMRTGTTRALVRAIVQNSDLVLLRDEASADALSDAGVEGPFRLGADPAWASLEDLYAARTASDRVVVALDGDLSYGDLATFEENLADTLLPIANSGLEVVLQPWGEGGTGADNLLLAHNVAARIGERAQVVAAPSTLKDARDTFSGSRIVLALQLHAIMAAAAAGSRAIALTNDPSIQRFSKDLDVPSVSAQSTPETMSQAVLQAAEATPATSAAVREQIDRAKGTIDLVRLLLTGGAETAPASITQLPLYPNPWRA